MYYMVQNSDSLYLWVVSSKGIGFDMRLSYNVSLEPG